jgi:lipoate-protein ligase A
MAHGIKISCRHKRELCVTLMNSNDPNLKHYYKIYCKILSDVIKAAKKLHYNRLISNSNNKMKTTWSIIKSVTGKKN